MSSDPYQLARLRGLFGLVDRDGDGYVTIAEVQRTSFGEDLPRDRLDAGFRAADHDGSWSIDFEEFCAVVGPLLPPE